MSFAKEHIELFSTIPLQSLFPGGMFDAGEAGGGENASRALSIIESLILEATARNALLSRYALLQTFPRIHPDPDAATERLHDDFGEMAEAHCRRLASSISPSWYAGVLDTLDETEAELFVKAYLLGHELWGHADGIALLVRLAAEHATGFPVPVCVDRLSGEDRKIPDHLQSRLGNPEIFSTLGRDLALGRRFKGRPEHYHIQIGPISLRMLEKLQERGWAESSHASRKLAGLVELASPFYFRATITILIETVGCVLGRVTLGRDRLGVVVADREPTAEAIFGA